MRTADSTPSAVRKEPRRHSPPRNRYGEARRRGYNKQNPAWALSHALFHPAHPRPAERLNPETGACRRRIMAKRTLSVAAAAALLCSACAAGAGAVSNGPGAAAAGPPPAATNQPAAAAPAIGAYLDANWARYESALARARAWLDRLAVNPLELRAHGIKGKKKLAEQLDAYLRLYEVAPAAGKPALLGRIQGIAAVTATPGYHDMLRIPDLQFKEDATSYLRVAFLLDRFGLDTRLYRGEIDKILPRLNDHMKYRGSDQRMAFHLYYAHFGLAEPFPLQAAYRAGVIAARHPAGWFSQHLMETYNLTHEIFAPYEFGENLDADFFPEADKAYLRPLLAELAASGMRIDNPDITAELTSCLRYLRFTDLPVYREALEYLLKIQWPDGKWGHYEQHRPYYGDYVDQGFYLHTTLVALDALTTAFQPRPARSAARSAGGPPPSK
jgi:hypothetical protein